MSGTVYIDCPWALLLGRNCVGLTQVNRACRRGVVSSSVPRIERGMPHSSAQLQVATAYACASDTRLFSVVDEGVMTRCLARPDGEIDLVEGDEGLACFETRDAHWTDEGRPTILPFHTAAAVLS